MNVNPEILATFAEETEQWEGHVRTMYRDIRGYVTTGDGDLIDPMRMALALPWQKPDGTPATQAEIEAEWERVHAMPGALVWTTYATPGALTLTDDGIRTLVARTLQDYTDALIARWPRFPDFPIQAQRAIYYLAWAVGTGTQRPGLLSSEWPHFQAAVDAEDWIACAASGQINSTGNAGVIPRNAAIVACFKDAANG